MNILMVTNTFTPHVGGVARSIDAFTKEYRRQGHRVLVVAPEFANQPAGETDVIRVPAIQNFNGSDFSVVLPTPRFLVAEVEDFAPDVVHSHHPFLLGATAVRIAHYYDLPLVFTHHTMYEQYTHYVPGDSPALKRFVIDLATHYASLCDQVVAPSDSVAELLRRRGVQAPIAIIPSGIDVGAFADADGTAFRRRQGIPSDAFVAGHVGRLAPEKNLAFLAEAVARFLSSTPGAHFLVVGRGPMAAWLRARFRSADLAERLHMPGLLELPALAAAYGAMDAFAFASKSETQGLVLAEAMAAGVPVVALDAPGVREMVCDGANGCLLPAASTEDDFQGALQWIAARSPAQRADLARFARKTAAGYAIEACAERSLALYDRLRRHAPAEKREPYRLWTRTRRLVEAEWDLLRGVTGATGTALQGARAPDRVGP